MRLAIVGLLVGGGCALLPVNIDPPAPDGLAERFELVAFYDEFSGDERPLYRWHDDRILVGLYGGDAEPYRPDVERLTDELRSLTGAYIYPVRSMQPVDIAILMDTCANIRSALEEIPGLEDRVRRAVGANCYAVFFSRDPATPYTIDGALITISRTSPEPTRRCIAQELTQVLGLPNDIDDPDGTVFSSYSTRTTLSESDRNIVRILYDPRLRPGMTRAEAMPIVHEIAAELEAQQAQAQN